MMADTNTKFLLDIRQKDENMKCADCSSPDPEWASYNIGVFLCKTCAGIHRGLGSHISKVKSIPLGDWTEAEVKLMSAQGNMKARQQFEQHLPICYKRPSQTDSHVLKEQWVRAKYDRHEFMDPEKQKYLSGRKEGYLWKRGKDDKKFCRRKFVLDENNNSLKYFIKDEAKTAKGNLRLDSMNATIVPEKVGNPYGMQITFEQDGQTRNLFLYAEDGKDLIEWFTCIRQAKLNRLRIAFPGASDHELCKRLTRDFLKEGWLSKTGPRQGDAFRRRWCSLDKRKLMYYEHPLDPFPRGEVFIGTKERKYMVSEGVPPGIKSQGFPFTLTTPERKYHFSADSEKEKNDWIAILDDVLTSPMSPQDTSSMSRPGSK